MRALNCSLLLLLAGCVPDLGEPASLVTAQRILAIAADPPESRPGAMVGYRALVAAPEGSVIDPAIAWSFCASPKPLTENDAVSMECLGDGVRPAGGPAGAIEAATPLDACSLFGPDPPPGDFRPRDADATGGFYLPVRARLGGLTAFALARLHCNLPDAPIAVAAELEQRYRDNRNPRLGPLAASVDGVEVTLDHVPAGARVRLVARWSEEDAERYLMFDPARASIIDRRESLRVSWFVTAGALDDEVTGRAEDDPALDTETTWRAPESTSTVHLWLVLRDSRGGVDFATYEARVSR